MSELTRQNFADVELVRNPDQRCPVVLLLDVSASMEGERIEQLLDGVEAFIEDVLDDALATKRIEVAIVTFGPVEVHTNFTSVRNLSIDGIVVKYHTPMLEAVEKAIELIAARMEIYRQNNIQCHPPWIFLITDGEPTDSQGMPVNQKRQIAKLVRDGEENRMFEFFPIGVEDANMEVLNKLGNNRNAEKLKGLEFRKLFLWLSASLRQRSMSAIGDVLRLPNPRGRDGWVEIE